MNQNECFTTSETKNQNYLKDFEEKTDKGSKKSSTTITTTTFKDSKPTTENIKNSKNNGITAIENCSIILKTTNTNTKKASSTTNSALISTKTLQKTSPQPTPTTIRETETTTEARANDRSNTPTTPTTTRQLSTTTTTTTLPSFHLKQLQFLLLLLVSHYFSVAFTAEDEVTLLINGKASNTTFNGGQHVTHASLLISRQNSSFTIDLLLNTVLLSSSFSEKVISQNSSYYLHSNQSEEFCYYVGSVIGELDSSAAFATCPVLRGFFRVREKTWHVTTTQDGVHQITMETNNKLATWYNDISGLREKIWKKSSITERRRKRSVQFEFFQDKMVVELYVVADHALVQENSNDVNKLSTYLKSVVNNANLLYQTVGIHVMLVGIEIWADRDQFVVSSVSGDTLQNFYKYRFNNIPTYNDNAYFISGVVFGGNVLGLAQVGSMCSQITSGGLIRGIKDRTDVTGSVLAHEIGHNFGLLHDTSDCECESMNVNCIMNAYASTFLAGVYFSSCSKQKLEVIHSTGFDICLHNTPQSLNQYLAVCDNGILEVGEECDCGRMPSSLCNRACCNNCQLTPSSQCAQGECCDVGTCRLKSRGDTCRGSNSPCDIPETCDGSSGFCPADITVHQGTACTNLNEAGYCFDGVCQNRDLQCNLLYGGSAKDGIPQCYEFNKAGQVHGYCEKEFLYDGTLSYEYTPCEEQNKQCGVLQCDVSNIKLVKAFNFKQISSKYFNQSPCVDGVFDVGMDTIDPGLVPDGSPCGQDMMCLSRHCIPVQFVVDTNPCPTCVHGKCGNDGQCHCDPGYQGTSCDAPEGQPLSTTLPVTPPTLPTQPTSPSQPTSPNPQPTSPSQPTLPNPQSSSTPQSTPMFPSTPSIVPTNPNNTTNNDNFIGNIPNLAYIAAIVLAFIILVLLAAFAYDYTHRKHIINFFKRTKPRGPEVTGRVETMKPPRTTTKLEADNQAFEDDHEYVDVLDVQHVGLPRYPPCVYANQNEFINDIHTESGVYAYNQPPMKSVEILNTNLKTPPSAYPPNLSSGLYQPELQEIQLTSRASIMPMKPPIPDAALKPVFPGATNSKPSRPLNFEEPLSPGPSINSSTLSPTLPSGPDGMGFQAHLLELNNNPQFEKIKRKLEQQDSVA